MGSAGSSLVAKDVVIEKSAASLQEAGVFLERFANRQRVAPGELPRYTPVHGGLPVTAQDFHALYNNAQGMRGAEQHFVWLASAGSMLGVASGSAPLSSDAGSASPLTRMYRNGDLAADLSRLAESSFGVPVTLDRVTGDVRLRVGRTTVPTPPIDYPTAEYANEVAALETLETRGDGIRSFLGIALSVLASTHQVLLIDEPEAFLHPSQSRAIGRWLGLEAKRRDIQVMVSTHDRDFLLGLLASGGADAAVTVLHLDRDGAVNNLHRLAAEEVGEVWADPVLRYSNLLQGLFHRQVVICEADGDCRFYSAVLDNLAQDLNCASLADDTLLVPSGGKARVAKMIAALKRLNVSAWAIVDFDALSDKRQIKSIVASLGHTWTEEMDGHYRTLAESLNKTDSWRATKNRGLSGLGSGVPYNSAAALLGHLRERGLLVVPVGEMEDFDKSIGAKGSTWVSTMLERGAHQSCQEARALVAPILSLDEAAG